MLAYNSRGIFFKCQIQTWNIVTKIPLKYVMYIEFKMRMSLAIKNITCKFCVYETRKEESCRRRQMKESF